MRALGAHRRFTIWIAVLAVLLGALVPSLSRALATNDGAAWIEICTIQGTKWVSADEADPDRAPTSAHVLDHCAYCSLNTPTLGLPPSATAVLPSSRLAHALPWAFLAAPTTLHAWVSAQPRAPPLFS